MMKKLIFTLFLLVSAISSYSQDVFPTSNAIWNIKFTGLSPVSAQWYGLVGDTIINDTVYSRLCLLKDSVPTRDAEIGYRGGIRVSDRKVWLRAKVMDGYEITEREILLYDFTLNKGDSYTYEDVNLDEWSSDLIFREAGTSTVYVSNVEKDELGRKHYIVNGDEWIEGIGGTRGLFLRYIPLPTCCPQTISYLQCFKHKGRVEYHNPSWCPMCFCPEQLTEPVSIVEEQTGSILLYPNPTKESIWIELPMADLPCTFTLYDLGGVLLSSDRLNEPTTEVSLSGYPDGTYIYRISSIDRVIQSGKVIVNRAKK